MAASDVGPLAGRTVVVTRARAQASDLVARLSALAADVIELPVIAIADPDDGGAALTAAADRAVAGAYQWIVVTSANAVPRLIDALAGRRPPEGTRWAAVGTATARTLASAGITADLVPNEAVSEALVDAFPQAGPEGGSVLFARAEDVRPIVAPGLAAKGWIVDEAIAYRTVAGDPDAEALDAARSADVIVMTSSSTVHRSVELLGAAGLPPIIVSIGPITSAALGAVGRTPDVEAEPHNLDGVVAALLDVMADPS